MEVKKLNIDDLTPYGNNPRKTKNLDVLIKSISGYGFINPIIAYKKDGENLIIAGHQRVQAARANGIKKVPVIFPPFKSWVEARGYVIMDNRSSELVAEWDDDLLQLELSDLKEFDLDLDFTGFDDSDIIPISGLDDLSDDELNEVPEVPKEARTQTGDIYTLDGKHRVMCGDSTDREQVEALMDGNKADMVFTDPPYGIGNTISKKNNYNEYCDSFENLMNMIPVFMKICRDMSNLIVLTPGTGNVYHYPKSDWIMGWFTPAGVGRGPWGFCCWQPILCYGKDPKLSKGLGCHPDAVVHTESSEKNDHPCPKPINFWCKLLERTSELKQNILDIFLGSGTTLIAAEKTNRICFGMEIDPAYCDVIISRYKKLKPEAKIELNGEQIEWVDQR